MAERDPDLPAKHAEPAPDAATADNASESRAPADAAAKRKRLFLIFGAVLAAIALGYGLYRLIVGDRWVSTDNAYVGADVAMITPLVGGAVTEVRVVDTQAVKRGQLLVVIDPADMRIAVAQAEAELGRATRGVEQTIATGASLASQVDARGADIARAHARVITAQADLERAQIDLKRRQALSAGGAVSGEELTQARNGFATARAALIVARADVAQATSTRSSAQGEREANAVLVRGVTVTTAPDVLAARAKLDQARLDLARTTIRAPFDGVIARRQVQVGQRVAQGTSLMTVVPVDRVYVDANFKEVQLKAVRPGQPVELTSDLYGDDIVYHGRVAGFSGGTGAAFAVIPAQNASGNWIKVVQRLPVRVALDAKELAAHPLRVGLSMEATIDTAAR